MSEHHLIGATLYQGIERLRSQQMCSCGWQGPWRSIGPGMGDGLTRDKRQHERMYCR